MQAVLNNFHKDDFIQSFSTPAVARRLTKDLLTVLQRGDFRLTKFISNNSDALSFIPAQDRVKSASETKVLGQTWCLRTDSYTEPPPKSVNNPTALRQRFSLVSSIFDTINLLIPLVIQFKIILQSLWKLGTMLFPLTFKPPWINSLIVTAQCRPSPYLAVLSDQPQPWNSTTSQTYPIPLSPLSFMLAIQLFRKPQLNKSSSSESTVSPRLNKKAFQNWNLKPRSLQSVCSE